jgi:hypothetical protein
MIRNINPAFGDPLKFATLNEMKLWVKLSGKVIPADGLRQGRDYKIVYYQIERRDADSGEWLPYAANGEIRGYMVYRTWSSALLVLRIRGLQTDPSYRVRKLTE